MKKPSKAKAKHGARAVNGNGNGNGKENAARRGGSYQQAEIALAYLVEKSPQSLEKLAKLLGRAPVAVLQIWSCWDGAETASAGLRNQMEQVKELLGSELRSSVSLESRPVNPVPFDSLSSCCESEHDLVQSHSFDHNV